MRKIFATLAIAVTLLVAGCAASEPIEMTADTVVIDVRTPAEYSAGHLAGALNYDINDTSFDAKIAELDPDVSYVVYCKSGNRAGQAVARMGAAGFTDVVNAGSLEQAAESTGLAIVSGG